MKPVQIKISPKKTREAIAKRISALKSLKNIPRLRSKVGSPPGTLLYTGTAKEPTRIDLLTYNNDHSAVQDISAPDSLPSDRPEDCVHWIRVTGLGDAEIVGAIGQMFGIHPLILEDILNVEQQPKFEEYDDYDFITLKMLVYQKETDVIESQHLSMVVKKNLILTFCEKTSPMLEPLRLRILTSSGPIRKKGVTYLAYRLIDTVVDHYYHVISALDDTLEVQETRLLKNPMRDQIHEILHLKKQVLFMRRTTEPLRDGLRRLLNIDSGIWKKDEMVFINDVFDHSQQILASLELQRETLTGLTDLYMSVVSNKMNEVMKSLTIIATIFIPLTFVAGIYGMNFQHMPELQWKYGYHTVLGAMLFIGIIMYLYMKRRHWF